ncbi:MAG: hypothetical protein EOP64_02300 [Sphingomonas sp.]|nr:MAG: hypothetical protein EOP64_02300 [Sphingomonas sp.]
MEKQFPKNDLSYGDSGINDNVSSSCKTTTTNKAAGELVGPGQPLSEATRLQQTVERCRLDVTHRVGANDVLGIWRASSESLEDFTASVEHLAWYLGSVDAKGINHPKAWMLRQLRAGYYAPPPGFVSWEERQAEARLAAAEARASRLQKLARRQLESDFTAWVLGLTVDEKQALLQGMPFTEGGMAQRIALRRRYAEKMGQLDLLAVETD